LIAQLSETIFHDQSFNVVLEQGHCPPTGNSN